MLTVADIAREVGGTVEGEGAAVLTGLAGLADAGPADLTFLANPRYAGQVAATRAGAVIVARDWQGACPCALIRAASPDAAFARAAALLGPPPPPDPVGVHPSAVIAPDAVLGRDVAVGPGCVVAPGAHIGDRTVLVALVYVGPGATVGADCRLYPLASLRERVRLGNRCIVHNGAVIGSDGFGYVRQGPRWEKVPQIGAVEVGDDVEIGANVTIDRARFGKTVIGNGVKIDNQVQVAHNVRIGDHAALAAQVGIAGSTTIGAGVMMGGQSGAAGHLVVGDHVVVAGRGGVTKDIPPKTYVAGFPAIPHDKHARLHAHVMRLPALKEAVARLEQRLAALERRLDT